MERETQMNAETSTDGEVVFAGNRKEYVPRKATSVSKLGSKSSSCRRRAELKLQQAKRRHELERREREL